MGSWRCPRDLPGTAGRDAIVAFLDNNGGSFFDGNHYALLGDMSYLGSGRRVHLAALQTATAFPVSFTLLGSTPTDIAAIRSATAFEDNGSAGDPGFVGSGPQWPEPEDVSDYMLAAGSVCRTGAVSLTAQSWFKDVDGFTEITRTLQPVHRGALDPDVPLEEQEIGPL